MLPLISVILPVLDARATLPQLLDELLRQNYPADRFEILVIDCASVDGTADLVRRRYTRNYTAIRLIAAGSRRASVARNLGVRMARGEVLIFIDGHSTIPSQNLLEDTAAILSRTGAGCLCRPQSLRAPAATRTGEVIARVRSSWLGHSRASQIGDPQASAFVDPVEGGSTYRREVFDRIGFFDESFDAGAEDEFNIRVRKAGIRAYTDARLAVDDRPPATLRVLAGQMVACGRGLMRLMRRHPGATPVSSFAPLAILVALLLAPLAWLLLPRTLALLASMPAALVAGAVVFASLQLGIRYGVAIASRAPWVFAAIGCGVGAGLAVEALSPAQSAQAPAPLVMPRPAPEPGSLQQADRAA
jgi:succinoglycan biosynthesis protein ExoA